MDRYPHELHCSYADMYTFAEVKSNLPGYRHPQLLSLSKAAHLQGKVLPFLSLSPSPSLSLPSLFLELSNIQDSSVACALPPPSLSISTVGSLPPFVLRCRPSTAAWTRTPPWPWWCLGACPLPGGTALWRDRETSFMEAP